MTIPYVSPSAISDPTTGQPITAAWGDAVNAAVDYAAKPPGFVITKSSVSIPHNTSTAINWQFDVNKQRDTDNWISSANWNAAVVPANMSGWYLIVCTGFWNSAPGGVRAFNMSIGGTGFPCYLEVPNSNAQVPFSFSRFEYLSAAQHVQLQALQTSGSALTVYNTKLAITSMAKA